MKQLLRKLLDIQIDRQLNCNPISANITKWSNTLKQFVGKLPTNCLSVFDYFVGLALKGLSLLTLFYSMLSTENMTNK